MGVVLWRDDGHETTVKGNDNGGWSSDDMMLWLGRRQNEDPVEWWRVGRLRWSFITVKGESQAVRGG
jgi:hypothetical protein